MKSTILAIVAIVAALGTVGIISQQSVQRWTQMLLAAKMSVDLHVMDVHLLAQELSKAILNVAILRFINDG